MAAGVGGTISTSMSSVSTASGAASSSSASTSGSSSTSTASRTSIANNFDQFLTLLTTQLKNQNPLDPLDTNQFTQELVQFSSVEQQLKTNDTLSSLLASSKAAAAASAADFIGRTVTADGTSAQLTGGSATWSLNPARAAKAATITISDAKGNVVATQVKALTAGAQSFTWDGRTSTGLTAPDATYTIKVQARDVTGAEVAVKTEVAGTVTGVDASGDAPVLLVGDARVPIASVRSISGAAPSGS